MNPERWQQVEKVYQEARHRSAQDRGAFLDGACRDDSDLRRKVDALLAGEGSGKGSLGAPTFTVATIASQKPGELTAGSWLGPYQIEAVLGAGGMGQVYRARDTRLSRPVRMAVSAPVTGPSRRPRRRRPRRRSRSVSIADRP